MPSVKSLAVSLYSRTVFAIDTAGQLWTWGEQNKCPQVNEARLVDGLENYQVKQVAVGDGIACCLTTDGEVFTWGQKDFIGQGDIDSDARVPTKLIIEKVSQISCGGQHTLLLSADKKTVWGFGSNFFEQLGRGPEVHIARKPIKVPLSHEKTIKKILCGDVSSVVLSEDSTVTICGYFPGSSINSEDDLRLDSYLPNQIFVKQKVVDISMGFDFMVALTVNNRLFAIGLNSNGQCGQGTTGDCVESPVEVKLPDNLRIKKISAGEDHCLIKCTKI